MTKEKNTFTELTDLKKQVDDFLSSTIDARYASVRDRDYYDGYQWTEEEEAVLRKRKQSPIVINRIKPKVRGLKGLLSIRKSDIKAFPRNYENDENSAHAVTDALRYVADNNDFDSVKAEVFENKVIEGYGAANIEIELNANEEPEIKINQIPWDRFYYDPHSRKKDFSDVRYLGEIVWLDEEQIREMYPKADLSYTDNPNSTEDEAFADRPTWIQNKNDRKRIRVAKHYYIHKGEWHVSVFTNHEFLEDPRVSPYLDEFNQPMCPIEADSAYIDKYNQRYGEVRDFIDPQDEINHRRSKALHLLSARQIVAKRGSVSDIAELRRESAKPDGVMLYNGDKGDLEFAANGDFTQGQLGLYQDAKAELDATSFNAQLSGERQSGDLSGKAIDRLQSAGAIEINDLYDGTANWEKRVFRQVWARVKQFWNEQKWVRVTDDQSNLRWVGLNSQITLQDMLQEVIEDESKPLEMRIGAQATLVTLSQNQDPRLQEVVEIKNNTTELDIDVTLEQSYDVVNIQQEQFQVIADLARTLGGVDIIDIIELSSLRNKKEIIEKIEQRQEQVAQASGNSAEMQQKAMQVDLGKKYAEGQKAQQEATQKAIENQILIKNPPQRVTNVSV